jgi:hypothetical protein
MNHPLTVNAHAAQKKSRKTVFPKIADAETWPRSYPTAGSVKGQRCNGAPILMPQSEASQHGVWHYFICWRARRRGESLRYDEGAIPNRSALDGDFVV